ncbi:uncharacterized protein LOC128964605 [Oppia nitens]|uniref:uncharacterized protein LOC128964605 n=1 Tax=Oppia nitens TaxID=1686743 RepID=UPI0023D98148|nr:uncharacterized protein LOC128964605 [Oppia nitens]
MSRQTKITAFFGNGGHTNVANNLVTNKSDKLVANSSRSSSNVVNKYGQQKRKFDEVVAAEVKSRNNNNRPPKQRKGVVKVCPFYKKIADAGFAVDAFSYGSIPGITAYFLTHFHSDHYTGLKNTFKHDVYCSPITARLVRNHYKCPLFTINVIDLNATRLVMGTKVTFFEANHCPGAVVILFELADGKRYLHTGDFRADHSFFTYQPLICRPIDTIYLDTTYCDPKYDFLPQKQILDTIVSISSDHYKRCPKLLIVCGTYTIGKENVFIGVAKALRLKIWTNPQKQQIYKCYRNPVIDSLLVSNRDDSQIHVMSMDCINEQFLETYIHGFNGLFDEVLAFRPTGWEHNRKSTNGVKKRRHKNITICGIEYSEHSSYTELKRFIKFFKPNKIIPTVNNGNQLTRDKMNSIFNEWLKDSGDDSTNDIQEIPRKDKINGSLMNWVQTKQHSVEQ